MPGIASSTDGHLGHPYRSTELGKHSDESIDVRSFQCF